MRERESLTVGQSKEDAMDWMQRRKLPCPTRRSSFAFACTRESKSVRENAESRTRLILVNSRCGSDCFQNSPEPADLFSFFFFLPVPEQRVSRHAIAQCATELLDKG